MTQVAMSKPVYRQQVGHDPQRTMFYPVHTSGSAWARCDFCGRPATDEMLILPEHDLRLVCDCCAERPNLVHILE